MSIATELAAAIERRRELLARLHAEGTDCVRLLHGVAEEAPGITIDRYGPILLVQTWREPLAEGELDEIAAAANAALGLTAAAETLAAVNDTLAAGGSAAPGTMLTPCWNHRGDGHGGSARADAALEAPIGYELGIAYDVRPRHRGQDPLLFLDLRAGRRWIKGAARDRTVLNLFAYTCGVGVAALAGGAREVVNVDFAASALTVGRANAARNFGDEAVDEAVKGAGAVKQPRFDTIADDVIPVLRQLAGLTLPTRGKRARGFVRREKRQFDLVVLDPPRWAKGKYGAVDVVRDYASLFKPALLATAPGGTVLATNHVPEVDRAEWLAGIERCAAKAGRPLAALDVLEPEDDFPSPDGRHPLKLALARVPN